MKRTTAFRIHTQGMGPVPGLYQSQPPAEHVAHWAAKDVAAFGEFSRHLDPETGEPRKRWVVKVVEESLYLDGEGDTATHPDEMRPPPAPKSHEGPAELGAIGFGTVTNP